MREREGEPGMEIVRRVQVSRECEVEDGRDWLRVGIWFSCGIPWRGREEHSTIAKGER